MSEQRRVRSELRQGLHQFLMQLYMSYSETQGADEAKKLVLEALEEQYQYFSPDGVQKTSAKDVLTDKIKELTDKMEDLKDYDMQLYYAEKVDALQAALDALDFN
jgi:predicted RNA-binding protein with EMAP domain